MKKFFLITIVLIIAIMIPKLTLAESIPIRGIVEGFYGTPWTFENRIDMIKFCGDHNLNAYIYAPKDDPYHRNKWREPYPSEKINELAKLIEISNQNNVKFIFAVSPGLDLNYKSNDDLKKMIEKLTEIYNLGCRDFAIFFDDIKNKDGKSQAEFLNAIQKNFIEKNNLPPLITVPTEYFRQDMIEKGVIKNYTANFTATLNPKILVLYTGEGVVQPALTDEQYQAANGIYSRQIGIWWNYPVNDYMEDKLALGAIENLPTMSAIPAIFFNPMKYANLSKIALATGADYANDPQNYDPLESWNKAIDEQFGDLAEEMKIFASYSRHLENNWAKIGAADEKIPDSKQELKSLQKTIKKLKSKLPKNILNECRPQLEKLASEIETKIKSAK